jgi:hypothetical protein
VSRPARAFIVRPFGEKTVGKDHVVVNFDAVEHALIDPALRDLNIEGRTTAEILESGNIRYDMFQRLLVSDLVIADLTMPNANVFYELGIRHALREKRTFLIYSPIDTGTPPFDLQTDRYLEYDHKAPGTSVAALTAGLRRTLASSEKDSPVFRLLPALRSQDPGQFMVVPLDFREEVQQAEDRKWPGLLSLISVEVAGLLWEREGLRLCARAQCRSNYLSAARASWERVLRFDETDCEANLELGSVYQTLGHLEKSNLSLKRVLDNPAAEPRERAQAHALRARNAMQYWRRGLNDASVEPKQVKALKSPRLDESYRELRQAFEQDLRCYAFGIEALARLIVWTTLADRHDAVWTDAMHDSSEEAERHAAVLKAELARLSAAVELSLDIAERQPSAETNIDLRIARAQLTLLTSKKRERVASAFVGVVEYASAADITETCRFLRGFDDVDVLAENVAAARDTIGSKQETTPGGRAGNSRVLVFRSYSRELLRAEPVLKQWIRQQVKTELDMVGPGNVKAIAGGCCGGDILFHEICQELGVPSDLYLPFSDEQFIPHFVQADDPQWIERFRKLSTTIPVVALQASAEMPKWLKDREGYTFIERWNSWMLSTARSMEADVTLIGICDESRADNEGIADFVRKAKQTGVKPIVVDPATFLAVG